MISSYLHSQHGRVTRKRVYISGPLTSSGDPSENVNVAMDAARSLIALGYAPLCPHLTWFIDPKCEIPHATWIDIDLPWVAMSEAVLRLPGSSCGADQECREAFNRGIPVFHSIEDLRKGLQ